MLHQRADPSRLRFHGRCSHNLCCGRLLELLYHYVLRHGNALYHRCMEHLHRFHHDDRGVRLRRNENDEYDSITSHNLHTLLNNPKPRHLFRRPRSMRQHLLRSRLHLLSRRGPMRRQHNLHNNHEIRRHILRPRQSDHEHTDYSDGITDDDGRVPASRNDW